VAEVPEGLISTALSVPRKARFSAFRGDETTNGKDCMMETVCATSKGHG